MPLASPPGGPYFPSGRVRISPQVSGAAVDSLALTSSNGLLPSSGIYAYFPAAPPKLLFEVNDAIVELASGDLDGDDRDEVVMATRFAADLKILYRTFGPDGFLLDRIPTTGVTVYVVIADYDGNGLPDIAYLDELAEGAQLMIAYGTNDRPLTRQPMAS